MPAIDKALFLVVLLDINIQSPRANKIFSYENPSGGLLMGLWLFLTLERQVNKADRIPALEVVW